MLFENEKYIFNMAAVSIATKYFFQFLAYISVFITKECFWYSSLKKIGHVDVEPP